MTGSTVEDTAGPSSPSASSGWARGALWLSLAVVAISGGNYLFSLSMARLLPQAAFVEFVGVQSVLLVIGTGVMAAVPWVVAREVAHASTLGEGAGHARRQALHFGVVAASVQGVVLAALTFVICLGIGGPGLALVAAGAALATSLLAAPVGFLQGQQRMSTIALLRIGEAVGRIVIGLVAVVALGGSAIGAVAGMPIASALLLLAAVVLCRAGLPLRRPRRGVTRELLSTALVLGVVQVLLTMLSSVDTVVAAAAGWSDLDGYAYQAAALLGRAPLFLSIALGQAIYPALVAARSDEAHAEQLRLGVALFARLGVLALLAFLTVPTDLVAVVGGEAAGEVSALVRITGVTGVAAGVVNLLVVGLLARARSRTALLVLLAAAVLQTVALVLASTRGAYAVALTAAVVMVGLLCHLAVRTRSWRPWAGVGRSDLAGALLATAFLAGADASGSTWVWLLAVPLATAALLGTSLHHLLVSRGTS